VVVAEHLRRLPWRGEAWDVSAYPSELERYVRESELRREENMNLCRRIDGYEAKLTNLRARLADRERRIRLARKSLFDGNWTWKWHLSDPHGDEAVLDALDLRKPLRPARRGRK
jgi:hypothetical protein